MSLHRLHYCPDCLRRQQEIDRLKEENARLKDRLRYQERNAKEAPFGSSTPSAKLIVKPTSLEDNQKKKGGAKPGHAGSGRRQPPPEEVTRTQRVSGPQECPDCGAPLSAKGFQRRTVIDVVPVQKEVIIYELAQGDCPRCHRGFTARAPGVFAKGLFGNRLLAYVAQEHYVHGTTLGRLARQLGLHHGSLLGAMHHLAARLAAVPDRLVQEYQRAPVKHADETGWRNDGQNGYAWLFCTPLLSLFRFRQSRSAKVALEIFGPGRRPGTLVVDRYAGYNKVRCALQYCYAHLLREVQDLGQEFAQQTEVQRFVETLAPLLAQAMKLRTQGVLPAGPPAQSPDQGKRAEPGAASGHPKNSEYLSGKRGPALPLGTPSQHSSGEQPGGTRTAVAGDRPQDQLWLAIPAGLEDARGAHERAPHPAQTNERRVESIPPSARCTRA